jgi:hypothetical protein
MIAGPRTEGDLGGLSFPLGRMKRRKAGSSLGRACKLALVEGMSTQ